MSTDQSLRFTIHEIASNSEHLKTVMQLADANSGTLGFLPYGAFSRLADRGLIIACIVPQAGCVGYLLYEISGYKVKLRHLCVNEQWRGQGITKLLIRYLRNKTCELQGVLASCRRDYNLRGMWASLGFVAVHERRGRSQGGSILTEWWLDYDHPNLFTAHVQETAISRVCAAIDANIFYDIADEETGDEDSKESKSLMADWLEPELKLYLTDEIKNEIDRNKDSNKREKLRTTSTQFTSLPCKQAAFDEASKNLRKFFPEVLSDSDASDLRQLARVIGSDIRISFFVTRDKRLLEEIEEGIYKEFGLLIIHPIDLILRLDELCREAEYQPIKLAGTNIERKRIQSGEQESVIKSFLSCPQGETKASFQRKIRQYLAEIDRFECFTVGRKNESAIALLVYDKEDKDELKIPIFRFKDTQFTPTILRHCIFECFYISANEGRSFTKITENFLGNQEIIALQADKFLKVEEGWIRGNLKLIDNSSNISIHLSKMCDNKGEEYKIFHPLINVLSNQNTVKNQILAANIERTLYPVKIADVEIPSFIIPIQSWWAKDLFDKELAEEILWGAREELALRREVVYYRSKQASGGLQAPGRILWYVSKVRGDSSNAVLGAIRACSQLDEIIIARPQELYKRFRRLGVYSFKDVLKTAKNDFNREIMAVKFSDTELFKKPIELGRIQQILGRNISVRSPYKLGYNDFVMLYNEGIL
jgi:GNAT superfamily N-acetyltransferase